MRSSLAVTALALAVGLAACAGTADTTAPNSIRATGLDVADSPKVNVRYPALLTYEAKGDVRVIDSCFTWSDAGSGDGWLDSGTWFGNGPYCFAPEGEVDSGAVPSMLVTGYPGTYHLKGYIRYVSGGVNRTSNPVSTDITVTRRY